MFAEAVSVRTPTQGGASTHHPRNRRYRRLPRATAPSSCRFSS